MPTRCVARAFISSMRWSTEDLKIDDFHERVGNRIGNALRIARTPRLVGSDIDEVGILLLHRVESGLDAAHRADVFHLSLFAGRDDQAALAGLQRHLRLEDRQRRGGIELVVISGFHVDEGAQAVVLAEVAARLFTAGGAIADLHHRIDADERCAMAVLVKANGFDARADRARLAAMLVHDDFGTVIDAVEVRANEVDFRLHRRQVLLRSALQDEARAQLGQVRNRRDVQEDVLRQHRRQSGENLFAAPALALEVDDVGLHEHRAAVAEDRHGVGGERDVRVLLDLVAQRFGGALQEVSVARRALRVQLEVFDATVFQDDELDVLPADVDDDVRILVELHRRLGVRDGLDQRDVGLEHVFQHVLGIAGGADAENFQLRALRLDLLADGSEHVDGVLNRIAVGKLVGLAQHVAALRRAAPPWSKSSRRRCR